MEATNQLSETKLISLDITEAKSLLMRLLCVIHICVYRHTHIHSCLLSCRLASYIQMVLR